MSDKSKSGYELRMQLLHQAQRILEQQTQVEMAKTQGKSGTAPTTELIIAEAEKLYEFVQKK
tara:strand:- start:831 stop:1016 length:186 start_codon:yes stop_codon:yes gene_type:complete